MARHSNKAEVVQSTSTADGADIIQWTYSGSNNNDEWQIDRVGGGFLRGVVHVVGDALKQWK
jgi:hypothetical protein